MSKQSTPRVLHSFDPERSIAELHRENDALAKMVASLEERIPTDEEMAFVRNAKLERERSNWAWQQLRTYFPWIVTVGGAISSGLYFAVEYVVSRRGGH